MCLTAPGSHPVPGGVFPPPPAAAALLQLLPPPQCFNVSLSEQTQLLFCWSPYVTQREFESQQLKVGYN